MCGEMNREALLPSCTFMVEWVELDAPARWLASTACCCSFSPSHDLLLKPAPIFSLTPLEELVELVRNLFSNDDSRIPNTDWAHRNIWLVV